MTHPTEQDRARAVALCEMSNTSGPSAWEAGCAVGIANERARIAAEAKALPTYDMRDSWSGATMERRDDEWGDFVRVDDIDKLLGIDRTAADALESEGQ